MQIKSDFSVIIGYKFSETYRFMENKIEHNTPDPRRLYTKLEEAIALDQGDIQLIPLELRGLIVKDAEDIRLIREMIELILLEKPELFIRFFEVK